MDMAPTVTLVGALVAAVTGSVGSALALLSYRRSGARDELAWRRSALVAALDTFLDSSFGILSSEGLKARERSDLDRVERARQRAIAKHTDMVRSETSLRLLADAPVVKLAEEVHDLIDKGYDVIFDSVAHSSTELDAIKRDLRVRRSQLFTACRANLGLDESVPISAPKDEAGPSSLDMQDNELARTKELADEVVARLDHHGYLRRGRGWVR